MELPGRVSPATTIAGTFASGLAAVSATGIGEDMIVSALAAKIVSRVEDGATLKSSFSKTFRELRRDGHKVGAIGVDHRGGVVVSCTTSEILYSSRTPKLEKGYP